MSLCAVRCCAPRLERRRLRAASPSAAAAAPRAPLRCRAEAGAQRAGGQSAALLNRRLALAAGAGAALLRAERAAAEEEDDATWTRYTRAFRARFETSISSATRAYTFEYPSSWGPEIVSLNDGKLYGVDLRLRNKQEGVQLAVSLLPYVGRDTVADAGTPEQALGTFDELIGAFWEQNGFGRSNNAGALVSAQSRTTAGQLYYLYETDAHNLISANATDGQLYLLTVSASSDRAFKRSEKTLRRILDSFVVPP